MSPRVKAGLAFAGVFFLGVVTGGAVVVRLHARAAFAMLDGDPARARHHAVLWALDKKLGLDAAQRARIDAILTAHEPELTAANQAVEPQIRPIFDKIEGEIGDALTPEQRPKFAEMAKKFHERRIGASSR